MAVLQLIMLDKLGTMRVLLVAATFHCAISFLFSRSVPPSSSSSSSSSMLSSPMTSAMAVAVGRGQRSAVRRVGDARPWRLRHLSSTSRGTIPSTVFPYSSYSDIKFAVLGGGAFSLALAKVLSYKNISSTLLVRNQTVADHINEHHFHPKYLPESPLPLQLWATADPVLALKDADYIVHAVPMQQSRKFLEYINPFLPPDAPILSVTKGVEQSTFCLMNDVITQTLGEHRRAAFLSGPSFAKEIMNGQATAVVIASTDDSLSSELSEILSSVEFRCHTSRDVKVSVLPVWSGYAPPPPPPCPPCP